MIQEYTFVDMIRSPIALLPSTIQTFDLLSFTIIRLVEETGCSIKLDTVVNPVNAGKPNNKI